MGMVALKCPNCGAEIELDDSREFGFCNYCGTKVMQEKIVVEHKGKINIDNSDELNNLYTLARRAKDSNNSENAQNYYEQILVKDPESWEAKFYTVYFKSANCIIRDIATAAYRVANNLESTFLLVKANISSAFDQRTIVDEIVSRVCDLSMSLYVSAKNHHAQHSTVDNDFYPRREATSQLAYTCGDLVVAMFGKEFTDLAVRAWLTGVSEKANRNKAKIYDEKIKQYDPSYTGIKKGNGFVKYGLPIIGYFVIVYLLGLLSQATDAPLGIITAVRYIALVSLIGYIVFQVIKSKKTKSK